MRHLNTHKDGLSFYEFLDKDGNKSTISSKVARMYLLDLDIVEPNDEIAIELFIKNFIGV